ncbi:hypothetical protein D8M21_01955 [Kocuria sp. HSID16901]|nr:hypothetical protein D8M21_01955 [Kocuria sp. HSID16901]
MKSSSLPFEVDDEAGLAWLDAGALLVLVFPHPDSAMSANGARYMGRCERFMVVSFWMWRRLGVVGGRFLWPLRLVRRISKKVPAAKRTITDPPMTEKEPTVSVFL